jgi:hypothetical protein
MSNCVEFNYVFLKEYYEVVIPRNNKNSELCELGFQCFWKYNYRISLGLLLSIFLNVFQYIYSFVYALYIYIYICKMHTQKNAAVSEVNNKFISHPSGVKQLSAAGTVQVSHIYIYIYIYAILQSKTNLLTWGSIVCLARQCLTKLSVTHSHFRLNATLFSIILLLYHKRPKVLRHELSSFTQMLRSWVRIPHYAWIDVYFHSVFVLSCV